MLIDTKSEIDSAVRGMLQDAGIDNPNSTLTEKLKLNGLSTDDCVEQLADLARNGDPKDGIRLRAVEMGLKMNGALKDIDKPNIPTFTIVINDPNGQFSGINPILIPRVSAVDKPN